MLIVALTGGIATGKSVVARLLKDKGCTVHEADRAAQALMEPDTPVWSRVVDHFGPDILNPDRTIDRRRLAAVIFNDARERLFLNALIHPLVLEHQRETAAALEKEGRAKIFVSEAALTIEAGVVDLFDKVIVVWCRPEVQVRRLMNRDKIGPEDAGRKIQSQMDVEAKKKFADYLIDTSGTMEQTERQTEAVYQNLLGDERDKAGRTA